MQSEIHTVKAHGANFPLAPKAQKTLPTFGAGRFAGVKAGRFAGVKAGVFAGVKAGRFAGVFAGVG